MRTQPTFKLDAVRDPTVRTILAGLLAQGREFSGALSKSVEAGQTPAAVPVSTNPLPPPSTSTGTLPTPTKGTILRGTVAGSWENLSIGTSGQALTVVNGNVEWGTVASSNILLDGTNHTDTIASPVTAGDLVYGNATPKWTRLPAGSNTEILTLVAGLPSWEAPVTQTSTLLDGSVHTDTAAGTCSRGDLVVGDSSNDWARFAKGTSRQVLAMNSSGNDPEWASLDHNYLANRIRTVFYGLDQWYDLSGGDCLATSSTAGTFPNNYRYYGLLDGGATQLNAMLWIPEDYLIGEKWNLVCATDGTSSNNFRVVMTGKSLTSGTIGSGSSDFSTAALLAGVATPNQVTYYDLGISFTGLTAGSMERIAIERTPTHVSDTNPDTIHFLGLELQYTADM